MKKCLILIFHMVLFQLNYLYAQPQKIISISKTEVKLFAGIFLSKSIKLPDEGKENIGKIDCNPNFSYRISYKGEENTDDGSFDKYNLRIFESTNSFSFPNILGTWTIESSFDKKNITLPIKQVANEGFGCVNLFLLTKGDTKPIMIDSNVCNFTNAPFITLRNELYVLYFKGDKLYRYSLREKKNKVECILHLPSESQNLRLTINHIDQNIAEVALVFKNVERKLIQFANFKLTLQ